MTTIQTFDGSDKHYLQWLADNRLGWVINARRSLTPTYMVLHRANCRTVHDYNDMARPGGFTERSFIKVCANDLAELRQWTARHGRSDKSFSKECSLCSKSK
ncbi:MAG TPA: hypothetical protein EYG51_13585 [Pseudomonadales bacterium]|nr:hypothetical protein [Pseudomonadales bacterium]